MIFCFDSHLCAGFLHGVDIEGPLQTARRRSNGIFQVYRWAGTCLHSSKRGNSILDVISDTRIKLLNGTVIFCVKNSSVPYYITVIHYTIE